MTKYYLKSKTLWANTIALIALILQMKYGFVISPDEQFAILTVINLGLRPMTNTGLSMTDPET